MWNTPKDSELAKMPKLYATEGTPLDEKLIYEHFFIGASDWLAAEFSPEERIFFGYAILNGDLEMSEWGYISFDELKEIKVPLKVNGIPIGYAEVERESGWQPKQFSDCMAEYRMKHCIKD